MDDEEVVLQNSALHDHLTRCGMDAENITRTLHVNTPCVPEIPLKPGVWHRVQNMTSRFMAYLSPVPLWDLMPKGISKNDLALHYLYGMQQSLKTSPCLDPHDVDFLDAYMGPLHLYKFKHIGAMTLSIKLWLTSLISALTYQLFVAFVSKNHDILLTFSSLQIITIRPECATYKILLLHNPVTMAIGGCILLLSLRFFMQYAITREFRIDQSKFHQFVALVDEFQKVMDKAIRLVQEMEIISRGYTLTTKGTPVDRIECNSLFTSQRQCPDLRRELFLIARSTMLPLKFATQQLLQRPASRDILGRQLRYLANVPLEQYGPCITLGHEQSSMHDLFSITDSFSVASIKAMCQLCQLQQAEFVKVLILASICDPKESNGAVKCLRKISRSIDNPLKILAEKVLKLNMIYTMDKANILSDKEPSVRTPPETQSDLYHFFTAIHSLELHVKQMSQKVQEITDDVEKMKETDHSVEITAKKTDWQTKLEDIGIYLSSCHTCFDECQRHLGHILPPLNSLRPGETHTQTTDVTEICNTIMPADTGLSGSTPGYNLDGMGGMGGEMDGGPLGIQDLIPQHDVFEGYVDKQDVDSDRSHGSDFTPQGKKELRKRKDEAVHVLNELKSVISGIRNDNELKENEILSQKYGQNYTPNDANVEVTVSKSTARSRVDSPSPVSRTLTTRTERSPGGTRKTMKETEESPNGNRMFITDLQESPTRTRKTMTESTYSPQGTQKTTTEVMYPPQRTQRMADGMYAPHGTQRMLTETTYPPQGTQKMMTEITYSPTRTQNPPSDIDNDRSSVGSRRSSRKSVTDSLYSPQKPRKSVTDGAYSPTSTRQPMTKSPYSPTSTQKPMTKSPYSPTGLRQSMTKPTYSPTSPRQSITKSPYSPTIPRQSITKSYSPNSPRQSITKSTYSPYMPRKSITDSPQKAVTSQNTQRSKRSSLTNRRAMTDQYSSDSTRRMSTGRGSPYLSPPNRNMNREIESEVVINDLKYEIPEKLDNPNGKFVNYNSTEDSDIQTWLRGENRHNSDYMNPFESLGNFTPNFNNPIPTHGSPPTKISKKENQMGYFFTADRDSLHFSVDTKNKRKEISSVSLPIDQLRDRVCDKHILRSDVDDVTELKNASASQKPRHKNKETFDKSRYQTNVNENRTMESSYFPLQMHETRGQASDNTSNNHEQSSAKYKGKDSSYQNVISAKFKDDFNMMENVRHMTEKMASSIEKNVPQISKNINSPTFVKAKNAIGNTQKPDHLNLDTLRELEKLSSNFFTGNLDKFHNCKKSSQIPISTHVKHLPFSFMHKNNYCDNIDNYSDTTDIETLVKPITYKGDNYLNQSHLAMFQQPIGNRQEQSMKIQRNTPILVQQNRPMTFQGRIASEAAAVSASFTKMLVETNFENSDDDDDDGDLVDTKGRIPWSPYGL